MKDDPTPKRLLLHILHDLSTKLDIEVEYFSEEWLIKLSRGKQRHWVIGNTFGLNSASADALARDKVATFIALQEAGIPAVEHYLGRSRTEDKVDKQRLDHLEANQSYITKPLQGSGGKSIKRHSSLNQAILSINQSREKEWAISPWYELVSERRIILLDDEVLLSYQKTNPTAQSGVKLFNLSHVASIDILSSPSPNETQLALQAAQACSLRLAAVDIATTTIGHQLIMEVNSSISMEYFARLSDDNYLLTRDMYKKILEVIFA